jgi:Fur family transcriptional regulator, peroxide stress response regulator
MRLEANIVSSKRLNDRLATSGLRSTAQRQQVFSVLLDERDHPTAEDVFIRARRRMPDISMATVYNCLDALVKCGLIRQIHLDRGATRYCPNMHDHSHFHCDECGRFFDIEPQGITLTLPKGFLLTHAEISIRGTCPECSAREPLPANNL